MDQEQIPSQSPEVARLGPDDPEYERIQAYMNLIVENHDHSIPTIQPIPEGQLSSRPEAMLRKRIRNRQRECLRANISRFKWSTEMFFFHAVCKWALYYAPKEQPFGLITKFNKAEFSKLNSCKYRLQPDHIDKLCEMLWALQIWAASEEIDIVQLKAGTGPGRIRRAHIFAAMVKHDNGLRAGDRNYTHAAAAWGEVLQASMGRSVESLALCPMGWKRILMKSVVKRWYRQVNPEMRIMQRIYSQRYLSDDIKGLID